MALAQQRWIEVDGKFGDPDFRRLLDELWTMHCEKSSGYGTPEDAFANFTGTAAISKLPRWHYPAQRIVEKAVRVFSLTEQHRGIEIIEEFPDMANLAIIAELMRRHDLGLIV